jgi:hypothetical protein
LDATDCTSCPNHFVDLLGYPTIAVKARLDNNCDRRRHFAVKLFQRSSPELESIANLSLVPEANARIGSYVPSQKEAPSREAGA